MLSRILDGSRRTAATSAAQSDGRVELACKSTLRREDIDA
jgi:hypothetical protein